MRRYRHRHRTQKVVIVFISRRRFLAASCCHGNAVKAATRRPRNCRRLQREGARRPITTMTKLYPSYASSGIICRQPSGASYQREFWRKICATHSAFGPAQRGRPALAPGRWLIRCRRDGLGRSDIESIDWGLLSLPCPTVNALMRWSITAPFFSTVDVYASSVAGGGGAEPGPSLLTSCAPGPVSVPPLMRPGDDHQPLAFTGDYPPPSAPPLPGPRGPHPVI